jgi:IclR family KDG regulon transcriptional repressor
MYSTIRNNIPSGGIEMNQPREIASHSIRAIDRAVQILECFLFNQGEYSLRELVNRTALSKTTVFRILQTLERNKFIVYNKMSNQYSLGIKLFELGGHVIFTLNFRSVAAPFLDRLSQNKERTVLAAMHEGGELLYIDRRERKDSVRFSSDIGKRRAPHFGMLGKTLMAYLPEEQIDELLERYPLTKIASRAVTDPQIFKSHLWEIREKGYTHEDNESVEGMVGIAAPVRNHLGDVVAAVGVTFPSFKANKQMIAETIAQIKETTTTISQAFGFHEEPKRQEPISVSHSNKNRTFRLDKGEFKASKIPIKHKGEKIKDSR